MARFHPDFIPRARCHVQRSFCPPHRSSSLLHFRSRTATTRRHMHTSKAVLKYGSGKGRRAIKPFLGLEAIFRYYGILYVRTRDVFSATEFAKEERRRITRATCVDPVVDAGVIYDLFHEGKRIDINFGHF